MSVLSLLGVVFSSAAMIIVLSGFSGLKNYSLEFLSYASPDLEISAKKGKKFVLDEAKNIKDVEDVIASILLVEDLRIQKN